MRTNSFKKNFTITFVSLNKKNDCLLEKEYNLYAARYKRYLGPFSMHKNLGFKFTNLNSRIWKIDVQGIHFNKYSGLKDIILDLIRYQKSFKFSLKPL